MSVPLAGVRDFIHAHAPHSTAAVYVCSAITLLVVLGLASVFHYARKDRKPLPQGQLLRMAFAAGPAPIYILLPLAPLDPDLGAALMEQQFSLLLAGMYGLWWTFADIRMLSKPENVAC
jgi:hypothetical protein